MTSLSYGPLDSPSGWGHPAPIPLADFTAEILAQYAPPMRAAGTRVRIRQVLTIVAEILGEGATTAGLNPQLVAAYVTKRSGLGLSNNTIVGELASLRAACSYAQAQRYLAVSPFLLRKSWIRKTPPKGKQHHSLEDITRVLELAGTEAAAATGDEQWKALRLQALLAVFAYTGLRRNEALRLAVEDVDIAQRMISLVARGHNFKTEKSAQPIPIPPGLAEILGAWVAVTGSDWLFPCFNRSQPWTGGNTRNKPLCRLKQLGERAGVHGLTFLSLRHSWATHAEHWGLGQTMIQRVLRHTTVRTQAYYRHADADNLRAAAAGISFGPTPEPRHE